MLSGSINGAAAVLAAVGSYSHHKAFEAVLLLTLVLLLVSLLLWIWFTLAVAIVV